MHFAWLTFLRKELGLTGEGHTKKVRTTKPVLTTTGESLARTAAREFVEETEGELQRRQELRTINSNPSTCSFRRSSPILPVPSLTPTACTNRCNRHVLCRRHRGGEQAQGGDHRRANRLPSPIGVLD